MPEVIATVVTAATWAAEAYATLGPITQGVIQVAALTAAQAVITHNSKPKARGSEIDLQLSSNAPRRLQCGRRCNAGLLTDWFLAGTGDPPNTKLYVVIALGQGPCGDLKRIWADGRIMSPTSFPHGVRTVVPDFRSGGDRLWITYYDGRVGQVADPTLVGLGQSWTENCRMTGMAYAVVEYQWDSDNMRQPVPIVFDADGAFHYDRREDSTAGGSGDQRLDDPSTWVYTTNPRVILDHYMLGRYWNDVRVFGMGTSTDFVPYERFEAEANICDEDVAIEPSGTQKRFAANGFLFADDEYGDAIRRLAVCMSARADDFGGRFGLNGVEAKTPVLTIDDKHVLAGSQEIYTPKVTWAQMVGGVKGYFCDPQQMNREVPYPDVSDDDWKEEDGGEIRYVTKDYEMEIDVQRAQRLAWNEAKMSRRHATLSGAYPPWCVELEKGDWFVRTGPKWGDDGKVFEVKNNVYNAKSLRCMITAIEVDPTDSAWAKELAKPGMVAPTAPPTQVPAMAPPFLTVTGITVTGATFSKPAIKVAWIAPTDPRVRRIYIEIVPTLGGMQMTRTVELPTDINEVIFEDGVVDGVEYSVRARFIGDTIRSVWSTTTTVDGLSGLTIGGEGLGDIIAQIDSNAEATAYEVLRGAAWRASNEARDFLGGELLKTVLFSVQEDVEGAVSDISLIGSRTVDGLGWVLRADTVIPAGAGVGSTATSLEAMRTTHDLMYADITFLRESIGGEYAQATLTSNVNGYITGFKFWNGGTPANSAFIILTEQFAVIGGSMTSPQVLFSVVGTEVSMLNVRVNRLVADTIETNHIKVNMITEFATSQVGSYSVPNHGSNFNSCHDVNFEKKSAGSAVRMKVQGECSVASGSEYALAVRLYRNGVQVDRTHNFYFPSLFANTFACEFYFTDSTHTTDNYDIMVNMNRSGSGLSGGTINVSDLTFEEFKR